MAANNAYLAKERTEGRILPFMTVRPEWDPERIERTLLKGGFVGFKPYPDMVSGRKGADISIFDFLPRDQWQIADQYMRFALSNIPLRFF